MFFNIQIRFLIDIYNRIISLKLNILSINIYTIPKKIKSSILDIIVVIPLILKQIKILQKKILHYLVYLIIFTNSILFESNPFLNLKKY